MPNKTKETGSQKYQRLANSTGEPKVLSSKDIAKEKPRPVGRPSKFTPELADNICNLLSDGWSLRRVCELEIMPEKITVLRWLRDDEVFRTQYTRAKQESADSLTDEILDIADDARNDWMKDDYNKGKTPGYQLNGEHIQRSKLRIDSRIWLASKLKPKKYGAQIDVTSDGKALPTPIYGGRSTTPDKPKQG